MNNSFDELLELLRLFHTYFEQGLDSEERAKGIILVELLTEKLG